MGRSGGLPLSHLSRCLMALGYPASWVTERTGVDVAALARGAETTVTEDGEAAVRALYEWTGEQIATPERIGRNRQAIASARLRAANRGWLPPAAFDDDDGVLVPIPGAVRDGLDNRYIPKDRHAVERLTAARLVLRGETVKDVQAARGWTSDLFAEGLRVGALMELRARADVPGPYGKPARATRKAVFAHVAAVDVGAEEPVEAWEAVVALIAPYGAEEAAAS